MGLILALILAAGALWVLWLAVRGGGLAINSPADLERHIKEVDIEAMQNLMSPSEEAFLRSLLSPSDYREVERARIRAMLEYLSAISWNAMLFMRAAEALRRNQAPESASSAANLSKQALDLRLLAISAQLVLWVRLALPAAKLSPRGIAGIHDEVRRQVANAWRLQAMVHAA